MTDEIQLIARSITLKDRFEALLEAKDSAALRNLMLESEQADIGEAISQLPYEQMIVLFRLIPREMRAEVFSYVSEEAQSLLIDQLSDPIVTSFLSDMDADDRTRLIESLPETLQQSIVTKLDPEEKALTLKLLSYPEDSVGRIMNTDFIALRAAMTVTEAMSYVRWRLIESNQEIDLFYVVDSDGKHIGEVKPSLLIAADPPTQLIGDIFKRTDIQLTDIEDRVQAVDYFRKYDRPSFPVVNASRNLIGYVTSDDVFDVAEEEATEDIYRFGGQENLEHSYFRTSLLTLTRKRAGWLSLLLFGQLFTGSALRLYDGAITQLGFIIFFLPLILSSGGNSGSQAAAMIIRGMAVREMNPSDWRRILIREIGTGFSLGVLLGCLGMVIAAFWGYAWSVRLAVGVGLVGVVTFGAITGAMMPIVFKKLNQDPAVSSSPFIASVLDFVGVMIFVNVAIWFSGLIR